MPYRSAVGTCDERATVACRMCDEASPSTFEATDDLVADDLRLFACAGAIMAVDHAGDGGARVAGQRGDLLGGGAAVDRPCDGGVAEILIAEILQARHRLHDLAAVGRADAGDGGGAHLGEDLGIGGAAPCPLRRLVDHDEERTHGPIGAAQGGGGEAFGQPRGFRNLDDGAGLALLEADPAVAPRRVLQREAVGLALREVN